MLPVETTGQGVMALPLGISDLLNEVRRYGILNIALDDLECLKYEIMLRKQNGIIKMPEAYFTIVHCDDGKWRFYFPDCYKEWKQHQLLIRKSGLIR